MNELEAKFKILKTALNAAKQPHFSLEKGDEYQVSIRPDTNVSPALFIKDTLIENSYRAHPTTIKALKKDIFVAGQELFDDLEIPYTCENCKTELDLQFWHFCPYCEAHFPSEALGPYRCK